MDAITSQPEVTLQRSLNRTCPRSGKPIAADALTQYRGFTVGFCNQHCRDDFAENMVERPRDRDVFDTLIARR